MGQSVVVYDVAGGVRVYETAYSPEDEFDAWLQCLNEKGKDSNPRVIERPPNTITAKMIGKIPRRP